MAYDYEELAQQFASVPLQVYGVYRTELAADRVYRGHVDQPTTKCALVVALKGQAVFLFDGAERYELQPGKALLGGARRQLEIQVGGEGFEYCLVHYVPAPQDHEDGGRLKDVSMLHVAYDPELLQLLEQLQQAADSPGGIGLLEKKTAFYRLLGKVLQSERHRQNKDSYPVIDEAVAYIQAHYLEPITLDSLAERCEMKAKYFSYLFHKYVGIGPIDYLIQYRMNRAYELLMTGQFSVSDVAGSVGYSDAYYFSRLFKKHKGLPPSKVGLYRRRNRPS
ncbi:helix-turn-helix domain-containing protein [Paenibacillus arenilitoris]|uniref:Helix-turn-helix transcriptional regulator n=1 Tax=Paenibacillus arenilitoris TaxID=2772299 RepID=A0A927CQW1_9BACL|nr:AraC family transcriptional regulator [Paenibacillus arenilitoris]MBD2870591.1 helix-turn-helix transcriptional regulator [Paenibacillus arenilitoris]